MSGINLYLGPEIELKLRAEENMSKLVKNLLIEYYENIENPIKLRDRMKQEIAELEFKYQQIKSVADKAEQNLILTEEQKAKMQEIEAERWEIEKKEKEKSAQLRKRYAKEVPIDIQSRSHFEEWLKNNNNEMKGGKEDEKKL